jgi:hypothetical protein
MAGLTATEDISRFKSFAVAAVIWVIILILAV